MFRTVKGHGIMARDIKFYILPIIGIAILTLAGVAAVTSKLVH